MPKYGHNKNKDGSQAWKSVDSKVTPGSNSFERVDITPQSFDRLVLQKGARVKVYRSTYCPRVKSVDGAEHDINCPLCKGAGFIDKYPLESIAFIQNQDLEKMINLEGLVDGNHVSATFLTGIELQYFTLVELLDFTEIYIQRVLRNPDVDILEDVLSYRVCKVNFIIDYNGKEYYNDADFKISTSGNIQWLTGKGPAPGLAYSIHYETPIQYRAVRAMHVNRFTQIRTNGDTENLKMNEQWLLAKDFLVQRKFRDGTDQVQGPFDTHIIVEE